MKRPLGLIGLTYLSVLAVVFYLYSTALVAAIIAASLLTAAAVAFLRLKRSIKISVAVTAITAVCACLSVFAYTNLIYLPITDKYSDKEIKISGYICDEVQKTDGSLTYTIKTDTVNGEPEKIKIQLTSYSDLQLEDFDVINADLHTYALDYNTSLSKKIFLKAYTSDDFAVESTADKHISPYYFAVQVRKAMKTALDELIPEDYSSLCKAVLLGDKLSLPSDIKSCFTDTGTTFLIVVSGMHLSIVVALVLFLIKKITKNYYIIFLSVFVTVIAFAALTGFTSSVVRSGVMVIITYCSRPLIRNTDALSSLGAAALVLTITNPFAVGDIGMLLSFAATAGIVLWSGKLSAYMLAKFRIKNRPLKYIINAVSVSLSASIWVLPVSVVAFDRISPFVVLVSLLSEPFVSALIVCSLLSAILYICPFISFLALPFDHASGLLAKYLMFVERVFASVPYCSVNTDRAYFHVWLAAVLVLAFVGIFVKNKPKYIKCTAAASFALLLTGWAVYAVLSENISTVSVCSVGSGVTVYAECGDNVSVLSCGGSSLKADDVTESLEGKYLEIDNIIIPNTKNKYSFYQSRLISEFDVSNVLVYDSDSQNQSLLTSYDGQSRSVFGDNVSFTLNLSSSTACDIYSIDGVTSQYVRSADTTVLFIAGRADASALPDKIRTADYLLIDKIPDNIDLLSCGTVIFSGTESQYEDAREQLEEDGYSFEELFDSVIPTYRGSVTINLNDGGCYAEDN